MWRFLAAACFAAWPLGATESGHFAGRRLRDALRDLEARGLRVIYSDTLVRPT
jgi:hypothetical protein